MSECQWAAATRTPTGLTLVARKRSESASSTCQVEGHSENDNGRQHGKHVADPCQNILGWVTFTRALHRSDCHDPHGIEHKAEQEAIYRKLEHGSTPQPNMSDDH
jgi:hypothetical protein